MGKRGIPQKRRWKGWGFREGAWWSAYLGPAWIKLDYPNAADAERGLKQGLLTSVQAKAIQAAWGRGQLPPQNSPIGGGIGIHGWLESEWSNAGPRALTWGCIAMHNQDLLGLFKQVEVGTPVYIRP